MLSMKSLVLCFGIVALSFKSIHCFDEEDVIGKFKEHLEPIVAECGPKFGITTEKIIEAKQKKDISAIDSCFFACVLKHEGFINDKGMFDKDAAVANAKKHFSGDVVGAFEKMNEKCTSVNDASVSDGEAGCDRAKLLMECYLVNKESVRNI